MFTVYILESLANSRHYIGSTGDFERRLSEHTRGQCPTSKKIRPFTVVFKKTFRTKKEAQAFERKLKSYKGGEAIKRLLDK